MRDSTSTGRGRPTPTRTQGRAAIPAALLLGAAILAGALPAVSARLALAQDLDLGGWTLVQANSTSLYTFPVGTILHPGGYLVLGRYADRASFEAFHGVTLGANVVYLTNTNSSAAVPMINGDETFTLKDAGGAVVDGPTPAFVLTDLSHHRTDPEAAPWTLDDDTPTPGSGVEAPDAVFSGLVISEASDGAGSGNYIYEFVELYYDADAGAGTNLPPAIGGVAHSPTAPVAGDDVTIAAVVTDADGTVGQVLCHYRFDGASFLATAMSPLGGDAYEAVLAAVPGNVVLQYYITAADDLGALSADPADAPATVHAVDVAGLPGAGRVVLFDHAHGQDAGTSGNWRIDDDYPDPLPADPASETAWSGQLSSWAYELHLLGHTVRSNTTALTSAWLDGVDLLVIPEPQNPFTADEIEAVRQFVFAGGSLFFIADHNSSDRDGDGWDSPSILGGYSEPHISVPVGSDVETFCGALFGLHVHVKDEGDNSISGTYTNVNPDPLNPVIHGDYGDVASIVYHVGNVMSLWPAANPDLSEVGAIVSLDEGSPHPAAWSRYGAGRVFGFGDSSDMADGTDAEFHEDNWHEADHRALFLNATMWLLSGSVSAAGDPDLPAPFGLGLRAWPNPFNPQLTLSFELPAEAAVRLAVYDVAGRLVRTLHDGPLPAGPQRFVWDGRDDGGRAAASGTYLVRASDGAALTVRKVVLAR